MYQESYDPLSYIDNNSADSVYTAEQMAKKVRDKILRAYRMIHGKNSAYGWRLTGQLRPYASFGVPDGRVRTVYYITYQDGPRGSY